jgi:L-threonylcarbamoyladenylate synthase
MSDPGGRAQAADALAAGEIIVIPFNGIFVLAGDADEPFVAEKIAEVKRRPQAKGAALVCPPEFLDEHVAVPGPPVTSYTLAQAQAILAAVHALGLILPAARPGAPAHLVQAETVLNVWTEQRPSSPLRELVVELRRRGRRALAGTSANLTGQPTITEAAEVTSAFGARVPLILRDTFQAVPARRRHSASIVDLTGPVPRLSRPRRTRDPTECASGLIATHHCCSQDAKTGRHPYAHHTANPPSGFGRRRWATR